MEVEKLEYLFLSGCQFRPVCFTLNSQEEPRSSQPLLKLSSRLAR